MVSAPSPTPGGHCVTATEGARGRAPAAGRGAPPLPVKMVVAGGFGVGKTTAVGAISEIRPLTTEAAITEVAAGVDDLSHTPGKTTTTVAMDFGCITIDPSLKLYLFGTPGQERFGFMWDDLVQGALGGLVIVDTRRLDDCYAAVDYFEHRQIPFAVAVNAFDGRVEHELDDVRWALDVAEHVPVITFDARERGSVRDALLVVLELALARAEN
ncbi:GTP-binding protein [Actinacidiphila guanduensis]|uniref:GTP-binding protein n=1 Tax=Actinacidiphila guanduensis TaxID=310781 RepID=UPI001FE80894|nr:ATP/GTP-binding protein [Actinacidiphila guanduensis]